MIDFNTKFLIIGLNTVGGSYALKLKNSGYFVYGITNSKKDIDYVCSKNMCNIVSYEPQIKYVQESDVIISCLSPKDFIEWIKQYQYTFKKGAILTEVSSVKTYVVNSLDGVLRNDIEFIPSTPLISVSEKGIEYSRENLFENAKFLISPLKNSSLGAIYDCSSLANILGSSKTVVLDIYEHDKLTSYVDGLFKVLAISLLNCKQDFNINEYRNVLYDNFKELINTDESFLSQTLIENSDNVIENIDKLSLTLNKVKELLGNKDYDGILELLQKTKKI